jgi:hypothetical protein
MAKYIVDYVQNFNLEDDIRFRRKVLDIEKIGKVMYLMSNVFNATSFYILLISFLRLAIDNAKVLVGTCNHFKEYI